MSGTQPAGEPAAGTQPAGGISGIRGEWRVNSEVSGEQSLQLTESVNARSSVSEVGELAKAKKKHQTTYICTDCNEETALAPSDAVRCQSCGNRILYKRRGDVPVQYEAR